MSTQVITRFDLVNTNRLRYLSYFSSSTPETRVWGEAFSSYAEAALPTTIAGVSRIPIDYVMDKYGRYHASTENYRGLSLQRMDKRVRNWICAPHVQDIDVVNAAPTVLKQVYDQAGCDTSLLTFFVDNYESSMDHLREVGFTGDKAKMVKNWMLFGYGYGVEGIPDWVTDIRKELRNGRGIMYEKYSDLHAIAIDRDEEKREKFQAGEKKRDREGNRKRYQNNAEGIFYHCCTSDMKDRYSVRWTKPVENSGYGTQILHGSTTVSWPFLRTLFETWYYEKLRVISRNRRASV